MLVLAGVVHGVDLGHAVGQVSQQPCPNFGVDAFTCGQEPGDFIHALAEASAVFAQHCWVAVQSSCAEKDTFSYFVHALGSSQDTVPDASRDRLVQDSPVI